MTANPRPRHRMRRPSLKLEPEQVVEGHADPVTSLSPRAAATPSSTNRRRTRATVASPTSTASAIRSFGQSGPPGAAFALSKTRARANFRADAWPARIRDRNCSRSSVVSVTMYFLMRGPPGIIPIEPIAGGQSTQQWRTTSDMATSRALAGPSTAWCFTAVTWPGRRPRVTKSGSASYAASNERRPIRSSESFLMTCHTPSNSNSKSTVDMPPLRAADMHSGPPLRDKP
jgi:hypothetical protein